MQRHNSGARFGLKELAYHTHNGTDSPPIFQPFITYIGLIGLTGTVGILPSGWSVVYGSTGQYQVTHNLNSFLYAVVANSAGVANVVDISTDPNLIEFDWFTPAGVAQDTPFYFLVSIVNNKKLSLPTYQDTVWTQTGQLN